MAIVVVTGLFYELLLILDAVHLDLFGHVLIHLIHVLVVFHHL